MPWIKLFGVAGLLLIIIGVLVNDHTKENMFYIIGGICLGMYSIYIHDMIFIVLQVIFVGAAMYDLIRQYRKKYERIS